MLELPKKEVGFYILLWICGISISLYRLYLVGQVFDHRDHDEYHYEDFKPGWKFLGGRFQDQSDFEWNTWTILAIKLTPFLLINLVGSEMIRYRKAFYLLPLWYTFITTSFLLLHFGVNLLIWFLIQTLIYSVFKSHILIWATSFIIIHYLKPELWFFEKEDDQYITMVSSCWMVLRCISFSTDKMKEKFKFSDVILLLGYSFYLPTMFCGPFIPFSCFNEGMQIKNKLTAVRVCNISLKFLRCFFWFLFTIFSLHFIYVNAILLRPSFVKHLSDWELAGLGIAMGHFFHLKYIVFYGIPCAWAAAEGFTTPKLPCCVSRVHLYSYMWRRFDHGLYQFLIKYVYIPIISKTKGNDIIRKMVASVSCFAFVFSWHGQHDYVFFWVLFNFVAVTVELITKQVCELSSVCCVLDHYLSPRNKIRIQCIVAAPLHCFSMISNYFFIGNGVEIGFIYFNRIIFGLYIFEFLYFLRVTLWFILLLRTKLLQPYFFEFITSEHASQLPSKLPAKEKSGEIILGGNQSIVDSDCIQLQYGGSLQSKLLVWFFLYGAGQSALATQKWEKEREEKQKKERKIKSL